MLTSICLRNVNMETPKNPAAAPSVFELDTAFLASVRQAAKDLDEKGYAVVPGILNDRECDDIWDAMWDWIVRTTKSRVVRNDPTTWRKEWPQALHWILKEYNVGQAKPGWLLRTKKRVIAVFALLYGTDRLSCSYDGWSMVPDVKEMEAAKGSVRDHLREDNWMHFDQTPYLGDLNLCVQSWVTVRDVNAGAPTITVLPGSHRRLSEFVRRGYGNKTKSGGADLDNWFRPSPEQMVDVFGADWQKQLVRLEVGKGDMVLWSSRTMHQGGVPIKGYPDAQKDRGVVYVCMVPSDHCDSKKHKKLALANRTTSHWPQIMKPNGTEPRTWGKVMPPTVDLPTERQDLCTEHPELKDTVEILTGERPFTGATGLLGSAWDRTRAPMLPIENAVAAIKAFRTDQRKTNRDRKRKREDAQFLASAKRM